MTTQGSPRRSRARRLAFALVGLGVLAIVIEGCAWIAFRLLDREPFSYARLAELRQARIRGASDDIAEGDAGLGVLHPYFGYARESEDVAAPPSEPSMPKVLRIESLGLDAPRRSPDRLLVGVFGGSVANQFTRDGGGELARRLRERPAFAGREVVLVVGALGGWKQPQPLMALAWYFTLGGELDLALVLDGFNEVALYPAELAPSGLFPAYPRRWRSRVERAMSAAERIEIGRLAVALDDRAEWARRFEASPLRLSVAGNLLWRVHDGELERRLARALGAVRTRPAPERSLLTHGPPYSVPTPVAAIPDLVALWERCARDMDALCRERGVPCFHFLQPNQYVTGSKPLSNEERRIAFREAHPYRIGVDAGYPLLIAAVARLAAESRRHFDLTQVFADVTEPLYIDDCCHFNRRGAEIVANAIADVLAREL